MIDLSEYTVDSRGLELIQHMLVSGPPGCDLDPKVLKLQGRTTLSMLMNHAQFASLTLFAQAKKLGVKELGFNEVAWVYSTEIHANDIALWIRDASVLAKMQKDGFRLDASNRRAYALLHLILPVTIADNSKNEEVDVIYPGKNGSVGISGIFATDFRSQKGETVIIHGGSIVAVSISPSLVEKILTQQSRIALIEEAIKDLSGRGINCRTEFGGSLFGWARRNWHRYRLDYRRT